MQIIVQSIYDQAPFLDDNIDSIDDINYCNTMNNKVYLIIFYKVEMKRCYYQILDVDRKATPAEIKTSYRKMAIKYHPDKNPDQSAKQKFIQINQAYNVLSDPNQRTWYDTNREKVLFNKQDMSKEDIQQYSFGFNIWAYFTTSCFSGYQDGEGGFYQVYREVFQMIKGEELKAYHSRQDLENEDFRKLEGFGDSNTPQEKMIKFYEDWDNFTTYKTFVWSQQYDTRQAGNRWMRREMQKQNKKQRQGEKKMFIKTIKDLVAYVKKRDPRFRQYQMKVKQQEEKKAQEKIQKQKRKKQEKEEMKAVKQQLEEQRFKEVQQYFKKQNQSNTTSYQNQVEQIQSQYFCQICQKGFKSQNQKRNHEKSKQHKQNLKQIEKEVMMKEQRIKNVVVQQQKQEQVVEEKVEQAPKKKNKKKKKKQQQQQVQKQESLEQKIEVKAEEVKKCKEQVEKEESESDQDDDAFMNSLLNNRKKQQKNGTSKQQVRQPEQKVDTKKKVVVQMQSESQEQQQQKKLNKAKLKKQKKAQQQKAGKSNALKCNTCHESFTSKTKLFDHLKKTGHASAK